METSVTFCEFSRKLIANTFFNLLGRSWRFLVALLLTPYVLSRLNVGDFGTWVLLSVFITSFNLLDLGLGVSYVKYISTYYTHRDYDRINQAVFSGARVLRPVRNCPHPLRSGSRRPLVSLVPSG